MAQDLDFNYENEAITEESEAMETSRVDLNSDDVDDLKFCVGLLESLKKAIKAGTKVPMSGKRIIDADKCLEMIDDLEENLPAAVRYGREMRGEYDRIFDEADQEVERKLAAADMQARKVKELARKDAEQKIYDAQQDADARIADAKQIAEKMISESEIKRQAMEDARQIRNGAKKQANELINTTRREAFELLMDVETKLGDALNSVRDRRQQIGDEGN